ncbi:MAG: YigZ family protein [Thermomicrobiales bacterium]|nr:YigZ family protein [Thermomicrobiales bacterium]
MATWNRTIAKAGSVELIVKKSRFICTVDRASSEEEARSKLQAFRKQYWNANHNCSAWILGDRGDLRRSNDDGEPSGTAGSPMLNVLDQRHLTDTIAVVTRYFGGVLLGAGGLVRAYGQAVSDAIDAVGIVERIPLTVLAVEAAHDEAGRLENFLRHTEWRVSNIDYGAQVTFELPLGEGEIEPFRAWLSETTSGRCEAVEIGTELVEAPV